MGLAMAGGRVLATGMGTDPHAFDAADTGFDRNNPRHQYPPLYESTGLSGRERLA
jgi:hypothetical protein